MLLGLTHILPLLFRAISPMIGFYVLSIVPIYLESDFSYFNSKVRQSSYLFSYTRLFSPELNKEFADYSEERTRRVPVGLTTVGNKLSNSELFYFVTNVESMVCKNTGALHVGAKVLLWLYAVH